MSSSHLPSLPPPSSQVRLHPVVALWHAVSVAYLAAALAHSHSHCLTVSLSHCLTVSLSLSLSHLSHLSHLFLISLISLSPLSLSLLSVSRLSVSLLSQEDPGKEPHIKDSSPLPPKRAPCFFLPHCPPLSHSGALAFAPPPWPQVKLITPDKTPYHNKFKASTSKRWAVTISIALPGHKMPDASLIALLPLPAPPPGLCLGSSVLRYHVRQLAPLLDQRASVRSDDNRYCTSRCLEKFNRDTHLYNGKNMDYGGKASSKKHF